MKNYDEFEKILKKTDQAPQLNSEHVLSKLRHDLKEATVGAYDRSQFHQASAWTRLQTHIAEDSPRRFAWGRILSYMTTATVAVIVTVALMSRTNIGQGLPEISRSQPGIYATPFYSKDAEADVIWAEGYQYIPANYSY